MAKLRPADRGDAPAIRSLIWKVGINPTGLDWRRFIVIADEGGQLLACGQIKPHGGIRELASLAVQPEARGQGLASAIICHLKEQSGPPLYLMCASHLAEFYKKFGFRVLEEREIPASFSRFDTLINFLPRLRQRPPRLLIMLWSGE